MFNENDPKYLAALVQGLQQQRNQANDTIAHLASVNALKDEQIKALQDENAAMRRALDVAKQAAGFDAAAA